MKPSETKIYLRFIGWFVFVSALPLVTFFISAYLVDPNNSIFTDATLRRPLVFGLLLALALVFGLSLLATRFLSKAIISSVSLSIYELGRVLSSLFKSVESLSTVSKNNDKIAKFLVQSSQTQQKGLRLGSKAVDEMVQSLNQINQRTSEAASNAKQIDQLAVQGEEKANQALSGLMSLKNLANQSQKLGQALNDYAQKVSQAAQRVEVLADTAKFLSLNASIEANKKSFPPEFSGLISQVRELNISSQQVASNIQGLAEDMRRQIEQAKRSSVYEWEETNKGIDVIGDTLKLYGKILKNVGDITQSVKDINIETSETLSEAGDINSMILALGNEAKALVKQIQDIDKVIQRQLLVSRSLDKSSKSLSVVADTLKKLVNKNGEQQ